MSSKVSLTKLCRLICMNNGFQQLSNSFQIGYLVNKAKEAAEICSRCDNPDMIALAFGSKFGHSLNDMSRTKMELEIAAIMKELESDKLKDMFILIGDDEPAESVDGVVTKAELDVIRDGWEAAKALELKSYADKIEALRKELEIAKAAKPDVAPESPKVDPAAEPTAEPDKPVVEEPKPDAPGLVANLSIPAKQKAALAAAGLVTFDDVIKFHTEKTLLSLPQVGDVAQSHILALVGFKE